MRRRLGVGTNETNAKGSHARFFGGKAKAYHRKGESSSDNTDTFYSKFALSG
jgi:hypothetical protein